MPYKIVVLIKQAPDMNAVRVDRATGQVHMTGQPVISSHDASALEAAIQLKEAHGGEVTVVSAGPALVKDALQRALGMGADKGIHIAVDDLSAVDTLSLARVLAEQVKSLEPELVLAGQSSDDGGSGQVGPQVAELLGLPKIGSISALSIADELVTVERDSEDGRQTIEAKLPVVLMIQSGLNEPRYPSLKGMMAAKKKPIDLVGASPEGTHGIAWSQPYAPARTSSGTIVQNLPAAEAAAQLVEWLKERKLI